MFCITPDKSRRYVPRSGAIWGQHEGSGLSTLRRIFFVNPFFIFF